MGLAAVRALADAVGLRRAPRIERAGHRAVGERQDTGGEKGGVDRARLADGQRADGDAPGIWTIDSRLSSPLSACDSIGTPSTGSGVSAATMPGRWAAPPAPAMTTLRPRARAPSA